MNNQNSISYLLEEFLKNKATTAVIWKDKEYSYGDILAYIDAFRSQFNHIQPGSIIGLEGDFSPKTIALIYTLIELNVILVPFDISNKEKNEKKYGIANLQLLIRVESEDNIQTLSFADSTPVNPLYEIIRAKHASGLVLFTSGSSGEPKGALHDFSKLLDKFKLKRKALKTINFLLFDHWGGLNTLFHIMSNAGTVLVLENRTPDYVCSLIEKHEVELLPTSPTFLNLLLISRAYERHSLNSLKVISYGAEPMPESLLTNLNRIFPNIQLQQTYGLIELGVMRSKSEGNGSLWVKLGGEGFQLRVVDNLLEIKSDSAMIGYLNAPSPFTEDGWFKTGDSVEVKGEYFRILGRKSELINVGGEKVYPQEVENTILGFDNISEVIVYGEKNPLTGNIVCAKLNTIEKPVDEKQFLKDLKSYCRTKLEPFKVPVKIKIVEEKLHSTRFKKQRVN